MRLFRYLRRLNALAHIRDCDHEIAFYRAQLANLPAAIARVEQERRGHVGRAATLAEPRSTVNYNLGR